MIDKLNDSPNPGSLQPSQVLLTSLDIRHMRLIQYGWRHTSTTELSLHRNQTISQIYPYPIDINLQTIQLIVLPVSKWQFYLNCICVLRFSTYICFPVCLESKAHSPIKPFYVLCFNAEQGTFFYPCTFRKRQ